MNIKLRDHNWETSGVYDLVQGKTQRAINLESSLRKKNKLKDKKFFVLGDSWSSSWDGSQDRTPWAVRFGNNTGAIVENHSFPGSGFVAKGSNNKDYSEAIASIPVSNNVDVILVQGGVNDINANPTDSTIEARVLDFATACRTMYPDVDIYYIPTVLCSTPTVNNLRVINSIVQNATKNNFIVCTDLIDISFVDSSFIGDSMHLSDAGYSEFARCVAQFFSGGDASPKRALRCAPKFTNIYSRAAVSGTGYFDLDADVNNFDAVIVSVFNDIGDSDCKSFFIPSLQYGRRNDVSWNATDSTDWFFITTITFYGNRAHINKFQMAGFTSVAMEIFGVNLM